MGKFGLGVQNEAEQSLRVLSRECTGHSKHTLPATQEMAQGPQILNTDVKLIIFLANE